MTESQIATGASPSWVPLSPRERRVLGVMVEKAKTTPEYYPMTIAAIVTACNQKSNRDPVTNYDQDDVEEALQGLRKKGATILIEGGGRVVRWKHTLYEWLKVSKVELAVLAELMLRGPQTEGDLRARASRMEPLADLNVLRTILEGLVPRKLVHFLSPPGQRRGVFVAHGLYPPEEFERVRQAFANRVADEDEAPSRLSSAREELAASTAAPGWVAEVAALRAQMAEVGELRAQVEQLRAGLEALTAEVRDLKSALGA
ncbi:MAG: YceH family protein [Isosphaeraceae bacterium]